MGMEDKSWCPRSFTGFPMCTASPALPCQRAVEKTHSRLGRTQIPLGWGAHKYIDYQAIKGKVKGPSSCRAEQEKSLYIKAQSRIVASQHGLWGLFGHLISSQPSCCRALLFKPTCSDKPWRKGNARTDAACYIHGAAVN